MEQFKKTPETAINSLKKQLEEAGINTSNWGIGKAKTLEHLQKEIEDGETVLVTNKKGELLRKVEVCKADIYYISPKGEKFRLKEEKQVFKDGRKRQRNLDTAISEKIKPNENPKNAIIRGIQEELGISNKLSLEQKEDNEETVESPSYPDLASQYILHKFEVTLNDQQFKQDGYIEDRDDLKTYFTWIEIK